MVLPGATCQSGCQDLPSIKPFSFRKSSDRCWPEGERSSLWMLLGPQIAPIPPNHEVKLTGHVPRNLPNPPGLGRPHRRV